MKEVALVYEIVCAIIVVAFFLVLAAIFLSEFIHHILFERKKKK